MAAGHNQEFLLGEQAPPININPNALVSYDQLADYLKDNAYIRRYHRQATDSILTAASSLFQLHAETANVISHGIAAFVFIVVEVLAWSYGLEGVDAGYDWPLRVYRIGAIACYLASTSFHQFQILGEVIKRRLIMIDYAGVTVFIGCGQFAWSQVAPGLSARFRHEFGIFIATATIGLIYALTNIRGFNSPPMRPVRAFIFFGFGSIAAIPTYKVWIGHECPECFEWRIFATVALYGFGAAVFVARVPERWMRNAWSDLLLQSHAIFHTAVAAGSYLFYSLLIDLAKSSSSSSSQ